MQAFRQTFLSADVNNQGKMEILEQVLVRIL